jgi:hypothetical protein
MAMALLDEMVVRIARKRMYLWQGEILDMLVQRRRDNRAALRPPPTRPPSPFREVVKYGTPTSPSASETRCMWVELIFRTAALPRKAAFDGASIRKSGSYQTPG